MIDKLGEVADAVQFLEGFDIFGVASITSFVAAFIGDFSFLFIIGLFVPIIGIVIGFFILLAHYVTGILILVILWSKMNGWVAKGVLALAVLLPLPLLIIGILLGIILSNKFAKEIAEQAIIQGIAVATGGAGEVLEAGVVAEEAGAAVAEGVEAAESAGEVAAAGTEAAAGAVEEGAAVGAETPGYEAERGGTPSEGGRPQRETEEGVQERPGEPSEEKTLEDTEKEEQEKELEKELETKEERSPEEVAAEELFENTPTPDEEEDEEEEEDSEGSPGPAQTTDGTVEAQDEEASEAKKASEVRRQQTSLKKPGRVVDVERKGDLPRST